MSALGEFDLIQRYFTPSSLPANISIGVGDDCAVLKLPAACELAISVDTQVVGVHFHANADPLSIASRSLRCAASDLAAMGAEPLGFTLALTLPSTDENWLEQFSAGLLQTAQQLQCPLIGGDTTRGSLCITIQVHGNIPSGKALRRSGAKVGDAIWISGTLGDGAAALAVIEKKITVSQEAESYLLQRFYQPDIDFSLAVQLRGIASSCIDVSDGLFADLDHICNASGVGAHIELEKLPIAIEWRSSVSEQQAQQWALTGGDDYRLCFTAPPQHATLLQSLQGVTCIGHIVEGADILIDGKNGFIHNKGFEHF